MGPVAKIKQQHAIFFLSVSSTLFAARPISMEPGCFFVFNLNQLL